MVRPLGGPLVWPRAVAAAAGGGGAWVAEYLGRVWFLADFDLGAAGGIGAAGGQDSDLARTGSLGGGGDGSGAAAHGYGYGSPGPGGPAAVLVVDGAGRGGAADSIRALLGSDARDAAAPRADRHGPSSFLRVSP